MVGGGGGTQKLSPTATYRYLMTVKDTLQDQYEMFLEVMKDYKTRRVDVEDVKERVNGLFKGHQNLIIGFNAFLPKDGEVVLRDKDKQPALRKPVINLEIAFKLIRKIKKRFNGDDVYKSFKESLLANCDGTKTTDELFKEVSALLNGHSDLFDEFINFLPRDSSVSNYNGLCRKYKLHDRNSVLPTVRQMHVDMKQPAAAQGVHDHSVDPLFSESFWDDENSPEQIIIEDLDRNQDPEKGFLPKVQQMHVGMVQPAAALGVHDHGVDPLFSETFWNVENSPEQTTMGEDMDKNQDPEMEVCNMDRDSLICRKYMEKPIQEQDISKFERCSPSYRLLPKNYPMPIVNGRTKLGAEVLNDHCVSLASGSEDFKHMRKNKHEQVLIQCEDDRFELDMLIESSKTTTTHIQQLQEEMSGDTSETDIPILFKKHITALDLRCIERLYGEHGLDVVDLLRNNTASALPIILTRLKQRQEKWRGARCDFNKVWSVIYSKNLSKSLDRRSVRRKKRARRS